jgi:hypothetical protein
MGKSLLLLSIVTNTMYSYYAQARVDTSKVRGMPDLSDTDAYGTETVKRLKKKLNELHVGTAEGKTNSGVHFFF